LYTKCYASRIGKNKFKIHLWTDEGYTETEWWNPAYVECPESESKFRGLKGEFLNKTYKWDKTTQGLHFHDMAPNQKFLIEKYGLDDKPSTSHREVFFDIECKIGGALTEEYISNAPMPITSIAWWDKQLDFWSIVVLDPKNKVKHLKFKNKEIIPCATEEQLLSTFIEKFRDIDPDILIGYNSDYFDIPYLYYRICNVLGYEWGDYLSPIGKVEVKKGNEYWFRDDYVNIVGVESLDYMRLHKKYYWRDEPNWSLNAIGEKWADISKIEYEGNLNNLYDDDIDKFIQYNFRDVEVLKKLDEKLKYIALTKNLAHKGKHNYSQVYKSSVTHDGAISAYLLSQGIIPPPRDKNPIVKKDYAGGYTYCPKAGLYRYMFDEDLTSLYPSIIMTINIGKETLVGRIIDANDRNNRLGLNDLLEMDPESDVLIENAERKRVKTKLKNVIHFIQKDKLAVTANGVMFRTDIKSVLAVVLEKWFEERVMYKNEMKAAYKKGDKVKEDYYHLMQYSMKILLNSLYGATALPNFRYGNVILSEGITLSGHRVIQESALVANRHINKVMRGELSLN
jgi:DNA polymerase elongation subunit (family B)